ncbi:methoxymalonate biosynthesis protein [Catenulispora sp. MAP12-49]|uniref:3-hydroxyacyl-CoA dehydrogenase family protein n=1 Tax=Catenulispora sp. MAP12-49 TaxID=3156302 RepID=UPI00351376C8
MGADAEHRLAIVGAGVMGTGIATLAVGYGVPVTLIDVGESILAEARTAVAQQLRLARLMGSLPREGDEGGLVTGVRLADVAAATIVVEAVTERARRKLDILAEVSKLVAPGTPLLSNTSAIPIGELAGVTARPQDVLGVHFMNPPYMIKMLEVIRGPRTGQEALTRTLALLDVLERTGVVVGDGPGFVINRVLQRMINEAARIVQDGIASPEDVDALFTGCLGHRTGPLATADLIGLDNVADSLRVLLERTGDEGYRPCDLLLDKVKAGQWGRKTGRGFFEYGGTR